MKHAVGPNGVKGVVTKRKREHVLHSNIFRRDMLQIKMPASELGSRRRQIGRRDLHSPFQKLQTVVAHAAADFEQMFSLEQLGFSFDPLHDPRKLIGVHPRPYMLEKL